MTGCVRRRLVLFYENESGRRASPGRADRFGLKMNYWIGRTPLRVLAWRVAGALSASFLLSVRAAEPVSFNRQIRPILSENCVKCHGGVKEAAGLNLLFRDSALKGGKSGLPAIVPGQPDKSELIAKQDRKSVV